VGSAAAVTRPQAWLNQLSVGHMGVTNFMCYKSNLLFLAVMVVSCCCLCLATQCSSCSLSHVCLTLNLQAAAVCDEP
jgi:hypothetical protein